MANRFPLIVNPDTKEIQEISQNDNLDLTGNGVYAGGSLGQNGQVLTTNGATVEWRTVTGGGGGGSGIDSDTTYIIESEDQADGASVNLVAGGSGVGTIKVKFADSGILQFNTTDNQTITTDAVDGSITNNKLQNSSIQFTVGGVVSNVALGGSITIPTYGDVFLSSAQTITNKTFENCTMSLAVGTGNNLVNIPNSSLLNNKIVINGTDVPLGGSINIAGGGGTVVNYNISAEDTPNSNESYIRLSGTDASTDNVTLKGGDRISITRNQDTITITNTEVNTDTNTDTTYSISTDTLLSNSSAVGARLNLVAGGDGVGANQTDRINLRGGTGVTITSLSDSDIQFSLPQDISTSSNVSFNDLTVQGNLTVQGALTYIDTTNLRVVDKTIEIGDGVTSSLLADGAGILIGTSNINWRYTHSTTSWTSTSDIDVAPTKSYKIGGTEVLNSNRVLGKALPTGNIVGTSDQQTLTNKNIVSPVISSIINTGTVYFPQPTVADTLVGRNTSDTLTNKVINGNNNTIQEIGNSSIVNSYMVINGVTRNLGDSFTVTATDPYDDEKAQDAVAGMITSATHSGISWTYDDTAGTLAATVTAGGASSDTLQDVTARGATSNVPITLSNILYVNSQIHVNSSLRFDHQGGQSTFGNVAGSGGVTVRCGQARQINFTNEDGGVTFASLSDSGGLTAGGLTYPTTNGTSGEILTSDGAGNVTWGASTAPVAVGYITMNGNTPSWSGTTGYTVAKSGGDGTVNGGDVFYTLTFPTAYSARTDYIVHVTYDGTDYIGANGAQVAVERGTADVTFCTRKWNEDPLNLGDLMVTVYDL